MLPPVPHGTFGRDEAAVVTPCLLCVGFFPAFFSDYLFYCRHKNFCLLEVLCLCRSQQAFANWLLGILDYTCCVQAKLLMALQNLQHNLTNGN